MGNTKRKLEQWLQAGLITPAQQDSILTFEGQQTQHGNWWVYSFMILGATIIGLGIISLIAANWAEIPDGVKLGADFALLTLLAGGIYTQYQNQRHGVWFEVLIAGFMLLCLASIGLISQIFHTGGKWYHALLFWSVITAPLSLFARSLFSRFFWVMLFLHGVIWSTVTDYTATSHTLFYSDLDKFPSVLLFTPLLSAVLYLTSMRIKRLRGYAGSLFFWFQLSGVAALAFADITHSSGELSSYNVQAYLPAFVTAVVLAMVVTLSKLRLFNKLLLLACLGLLLLYFQPDLLFTGEHRYSLFGVYDHENVSFWRADDLRAPLLSLSILFLYAIHAGNIGHQNTFNLVTFLIGLRFVILYFQAFGGLAATGVGLILSGGLIMGIAWVWYKGRGRLRAWTRGMWQ